MKTIYYSEKLNKQFDTEAACIAAEKAFDEKNAAAEKLKAQKKARAEEVAAAYSDYLKTSTELLKKYNTLKQAFIKDYGAFHLTQKDGEVSVSDAAADLTDSFASLFKYFDL